MHLFLLQFVHVTQGNFFYNRNSNKVKNPDGNWVEAAQWPPEFVLKGEEQNGIEQQTAGISDTGTSENR
jgi:hypothetical protein